MTPKTLPCGCIVMVGGGRYQVIKHCEVAETILQQRHDAKNKRDETAHTRLWLAYREHMKDAR